jgi:hypothetical protein
MRMATIQVINPAGRDEFIELSDEQAWALAELCKRITFSDCRGNAVNDNEAYMMIEATNKLGNVLGRAGYNPR